MLKYKQILKNIKEINQNSRHDNLILAAGMYYDNVSKTLFQYPNFKTTLDSDQLDYFRYRELELIAYELKRKKISGQMAEIGVYRGDFSKNMNQLFPDKKLYLFDTFSGFETTDIIWEKNNNLVEDGFLTIIDEYQNTSIDIVMNQMKYPKQCIIKSGYFPNSLNGLEENFCLVSIDVDLYLPTINALKYFYPRLEKNGYILLHDYNHDELSGVKQAIWDYEKLVDNLIILPIADQCGTLIITK